MASIRPDQALMPSMLDRLIDPESGGTQWRRGYGLQQMIDAVRRDLEDLLNTRQPMVKISEDFPLTKTSLVNYGLPDFASIDTGTQMARHQISQRIEELIERYEPRMRDVRAVIVEAEESADRSVKFHIEGRLRVDPAPEVAFETVLELLTGHATVRTRV